MATAAIARGPSVFLLFKSVIYTPRGFTRPVDTARAKLMDRDLETPPRAATSNEKTGYARRNLDLFPNIPYRDVFFFYSRFVRPLLRRSFRFEEEEEHVVFLMP